jgi:hypothetical protein
MGKRRRAEVEAKKLKIDPPSLRELWRDMSAAVEAMADKELRVESRATGGWRMV